MDYIISLKLPTSIERSRIVLNSVKQLLWRFLDPECQHQLEVMLISELEVSASSDSDETQSCDAPEWTIHKQQDSSCCGNDLIRTTEREKSLGGSKKGKRLNRSNKNGKKESSTLLGTTLFQHDHTVSQTNGSKTNSKFDLRSSVTYLQARSDGWSRREVAKVVQNILLGVLASSE
jgi:hypothetical protein